MNWTKLSVREFSETSNVSVLYYFDDKVLIGCNVEMDASQAVDFCICERGRGFPIKTLKDLIDHNYPPNDKFLSNV